MTINLECPFCNKKDLSCLKAHLKSDKCKDTTGISRIDHKKTHCWSVRLGCVYKKKPLYQKHFSDIKCGGIKQSLIDAMFFRDDHIKLVPQTHKLSWKNRTSEEMRCLQKTHKKERIFVGTGQEAAIKAYAMGLGKITCYKIRNGKQNWVMPGSGGWHNLPQIEKVTHIKIRKKVKKLPTPPKQRNEIILNDFRKDKATWSELSRNEIREREKALGPRRIQVGKGLMAAKAAYDLGAAYHTCWRIAKGLQDFYHAGIPNGTCANWRDPQNTLNWAGINKQERIKRQKESGYLGQKIIFGKGIDAAKKAQLLGVSPSVARRICIGLQNFAIMNGGEKTERWNLTGFPTHVDDKTLKYINWCANNYRKMWMSKEDIDEAAGMALMYYSSTNIPIYNPQMYALKLTRKCIRILTMRHFNKKNLSLDISGSGTEHFGEDGDNYARSLKIDLNYQAERQCFAAPDAGLYNEVEEFNEDNNEIEEEY